MLLKVTTTLGEAIDRLSILQIKHDLRMPINTTIYMELLIWQNTEGYSELLDINKKLWDIEDSIREAHGKQDNAVIATLSKEIIRWNKTRSVVKAKIDERSGVIPEPKNYFEP